MALVPRVFHRVMTLAVCLCGTAMHLHAQTVRADSSDVTATVARFHQALAARDSVRAISLLASDVLVLEGGVIETREQYVSHHLAADMKAMQGSTAVRTVVRVTMMGDAAHVVSKSTTPATNADASNGSEMAEIMVLSKGANGWTIRAIHWSSRRRRA